MATTMTPSYSSPSVFTDLDKFDGTNWMAWKPQIVIAARLRGARGYLDGSIPSPTTITPANVVTTMTTTPTATTTSITATAWTSCTPSEEEWDLCDVWTITLITSNMKNPVGLGIKIDGSAANAWKSLLNQYDTQSDLAKIHLQRELRNLAYTNGSDLLAHIANLRMKWMHANLLGVNISDDNFRTIILTLLPPSWDTLVATLYDSKSSADAIMCINMHWMQIDHGSSISTPGTSAIALQTQTQARKPKVMHCTNCDKCGHLITNCYWPGGGKEGQFLPSFGQHGGATGSANGIVAQGNNTTTANVMVIETVYALLASTDEVVSAGDKGDGGTGYMVSGIPGEDFGGVRVFMANVPDEELLTYADSGASDHCLANKTDFSTYEPFLENRIEQAASRGARFRIHGKGTVIKMFVSKGHQSTVTFHNALHHLDFTANLISISCFDDAGFTITFSGRKATFADPVGNMFIHANRVNGMYLMADLLPSAHAYPAESHEKPTNLDTWHRRFTHAGITLIENMAKKGLVNGLDVTTSEGELGKCEDCIYGKQVSCLYDEVVIPESEVLACIHVDLWGPARVQSMGGVKYLMIFTDDVSSYRKAFFLLEKSADAALQAIKEYRAESELQTGRKIKKFCYDMGKEFLNRASDEYCKELGIIQQSPAPYAHSANGVPERTNRTVLEGVHCILCDSGLPTSLWADTATMVIYARNFIPSSRHPDKVPAEVWTGKCQDITHLRPFGSATYAKIPKEVNPSKLSSTSIKYYLIGYYGHDTYKLYDRNTGKIIKSRNVMFEEGIGHRTLPTAQRGDIDDEEVFAVIDNSEDVVPTNNALGSVLHDPHPIAPCHRQTDILHAPDLAAQPDVEPIIQPFEPHLPPPLRRSTRITNPTINILASNEAEECAEQAKQDGKAWATGKETEPKKHRPPGDVH